MSENVRDAAESIIGNLDEDGYLSASLEEIAAAGRSQIETSSRGLQVVQSLDPAGVGARNLRECLLLADREHQRQGRRGLADRVEPPAPARDAPVQGTGAKCWGGPLEHIEIAVAMIQQLNPRPGLRYSGAGARVVEPDVYFTKDGDDLHHSDERRGSAAASPERAVPPDARSRQRRHQGSSRLRPRALHLGHPVDEEHRAAQADHPQGLPGHRAPPDRFPQQRHRPV